MVNHFGGRWKAGGGNTVRRNVLLSILNENDAVLFNNQMSLMFTKLPLKHVCPNVHQWVNKLCHIHSKEQHSARKRNEVLIVLKHGYELENILRF